MNARKCDRCGEYYEVDEKKKEREYGVVRKIKTDMGFNRTSTKSRSLDLCEPCYREFLAYVKPKKEKKNG